MSRSSADICKAVCREYSNAQTVRVVYAFRAFVWRDSIYLEVLATQALIRSGYSQLPRFSNATLYVDFKFRHQWLFVY